MGSIRKPFNDRAGYVASRKNALTNIHNVIYVASQQGIDVGMMKYVTVCEAHGRIIGSPNIPTARIDMKDASQWCGVCRSLMSNTSDDEDEGEYADDPLLLSELVDHQSEFLEPRQY